ncbi:TonB family protein, partial [Pelomonas saccharophila]|nr:TonB family protein [Roseateles saccharophilus]
DEGPPQQHGEDDREHDDLLERAGIEGAEALDQAHADRAAAVLLLASAPPTPAPAAPLAAAAKAVEPPPAPVEEEVPLQLLSKVAPIIPRQLLTQSFRTGFAQVQFTVQPDGKVGEVHVLKASHARLGSAAIDAVRQWRFAPIPKPRDAAVEISFNSDEG